MFQSAVNQSRQVRHKTSACYLGGGTMDGIDQKFSNRIGEMRSNIGNADSSRTGRNQE